MSDLLYVIRLCTANYRFWNSVSHREFCNGRSQVLHKVHGSCSTDQGTSCLQMQKVNWRLRERWLRRERLPLESQGSSTQETVLPL